jgi:hypothetical protein
MDHYPVILRFPDYHQINGIFVLNEDADDCTLSLQYEEHTISATAADYFEAMCQIRQLLDAEGIAVLCYGASLNVYPSGMGRDMGQGLKACKMRMGQPTRMLDLVSIFAYESDVQPATVAQQQAYFQAWLKSF